MAYKWLGIILHTSAWCDTTVRFIVIFWKLKFCVDACSIVQRLTLCSGDRCVCLCVCLCVWCFWLITRTIGDDIFVPPFSHARIQICTVRWMPQFVTTVPFAPPPPRLLHARLNTHWCCEMSAIILVLSPSLLAGSIHQQVLWEGSPGFLKGLTEEQIAQESTFVTRLSSFCGNEFCLGQLRLLD